MRADRLVATLLMLQAKGRVTAAEVADELEVSERTARRDLEALCLAGIPVYSQRGRGGGWVLIGGHRTDLTGLTAAEARALFLVAGPSSNASPDVRAALRKLVGALPEPFRLDAAAASTAIHVDAAAWGGQGDWPEPPFLPALREAVVAGRRARIGYRDRVGNITDRVIDPLGLVAKGPTWYLIAGTDAGQRTFRVFRVTSVEVLDEPADRPAGFDLAETWKGISVEVEDRRAAESVTIVASAYILPVLRGMFGNRLRKVGDEPDEHQRLRIAGSSPQILASELAGFAEHIEIVEPPAARAHLAMLGRALVARYVARDIDADGGYSRPSNAGG